MKIVKLISDRLVFEPLSSKHLSTTYVNWMNDDIVNKFLESGGDYTLEKLKNFLIEQEKSKILFWAIKIKKTKKHIGNIKINPIDKKTNSGEYGIMIGDKIEWGKGFGFEASKTVLNFCFDELNLSEITLGVNNGNKSAIKLYRKLGFKEYDRIKFPDKYLNVKDNIVRMTKKNTINKIILGTAQFGMNYGINNKNGQISKEEIVSILNYAFDNGIRFLDTAELYGNAIDMIGEFHKEHPEKKFKIFSKAVLRDNNPTKDLFENLKRLCIDKYEGYMIHSYQDLIKDRKLYDKIHEAKKAGLIKKVGISLYSNQEIKDTIENHNFDFIQLPFNLLDNSNKREDIIRSAISSKIEIQIRSIFLQGLFFMSKSLIPIKLKPLEKYIDQLTKICSDLSLEFDELAIKYPIQKDYVDKVIFGIDNITQLQRNVSILRNNQSIPHVKIDAIDVLENKLLNPTNW